MENFSQMTITYLTVTSAISIFVVVSCIENCVNISEKCEPQNRPSQLFPWVILTIIGILFMLVFGIASLTNLSDLNVNTHKLNRAMKNDPQLGSMVEKVLKNESKPEEEK